MDYRLRRNLINYLLIGSVVALTLPIIYGVSKQKGYEDRERLLNNQQTITQPVRAEEGNLPGIVNNRR